jgi:ribosomal protein L19E
MNKKRLPLIVGGVIVLAAAGWFAWDYFAEEPAPPPTPSKPVSKPAAPKAQSAADAAKTQDKQIEDVVAATGLKQQLEQLPQRLAAGVAQAGKQQKKVPTATIQSIEEAMAKGYTAEGFQNRVDAELKKNYDQKHMQALLKEFSTPAAKTMVEQERVAQQPNDLAKFAISPVATKPERAALVQRIDAATKASELAVQTAFVSMKALSQGIAGEGSAKAAAIDKSMEKQREAETRRIRDATQLSLAYSYKDASDADLEKYAALYETADAKWFYGLVYEALLGEIKDASIAAGERLAELKAKPAASAAKAPGAKSGADARACLKFATDAAIARCAEAYR